MIEIYTRETLTPLLDKLKSEGKNIWSISKINNYNTCPRQYYYTYIEKLKQKTGIYSLLGSSAHTDAEDLYNGVTDKLTPNNFNENWIKAELFNIKFPNENIKKNYKIDMDICYKNYKKMEGDFLSEVGFLLEIDNNNYLQGYIDLIQVLPDNTMKIYDFKTSSYYKGDKLVEAARQLAIYQMALERLYGCNVEANGWIFFKYSDVTIGDYKKIVAVQNKDIVKRCEATLKKFMKKKKIDEAFIEMYIGMCYANSSLDCLPDEIRNEITIETHIKYYDIDQNFKDETMKYIKDSIATIESKDKTNKECWNCEFNDFFCKNLCGFSGLYCRL